MYARFGVALTPRVKIISNSIYNLVLALNTLAADRPQAQIANLI